MQFCTEEVEEIKPNIQLALTAWRESIASLTAGSREPSTYQTQGIGTLAGKIVKESVLDEEPDDIGDMVEIPES